MNNPQDDPKSRSDPDGPPTGAGPTRVIAPSARATAALAAVMLVVGGVLGAAIGPGPSSSLAGVPIQRLLPTIAALAGVGHRGSGRAGTQPPAVTPPINSEPAPAAETAAHKRHRRRRRHAGTGAAFTSNSQAEAVSPTTPTRPTGPTTTTGAGKTKTMLPPVSKVWLIELTGSSFAQATGQAATAPYIDTEAVHEGTLLDGWSALDASTFAGDAALIAGSSPQLLDTIVQPPCPEGAAGVSCAAGTPGALTAADEFLKATLPTIVSTAGYRENGLIVVTFASIAPAGASGLPAGAATATLTSQPPAGALLISPFVAAGAKSPATFDPTSPKQSLEQLLRR